MAEKTLFLKQVNEYYQPKEVFTSYDNIYIPARKDYAFKLFYDFYDDFLNDLLEDTQKVFPGLSMEVRLDVDPVSAQDGNGETGASHYGTFQCGNAEYTSLMYSVGKADGFRGSNWVDWGYLNLRMIGTPCHFFYMTNCTTFCASINGTLSIA